MNELSQYLVNQILLEDAELHNFVVVYSGRFQPFHKGHYATYQNLCKKFGKDKVFIGTSNKTDNRQSPFNFKEKKIIMTKMFGIPSNKIVEIKNPYAPTEILKNFDENTTGYISVVGEKDELRLGGKYFEKYKGKIEQGYKDKGYVYISPSQSNPISGTNVRNWLSKGDDEQQKAGFLKAYPKFDEKIFKLITLKLKNMSEGMPGGVGVGLSFPNGTINGAPKPEDVKKTRKKLDSEDDELTEEIKLDVEIGDTILMGKFKNKKTVVKTIGKDEHGMPTINGKKVATFRILPKVNIFKEIASVGSNDDSQPDGGYLPKGKTRVLGGDDGVNKSDEWFVRGGYVQTDFPKADAIYAKDDENQYSFSIKSKNNARNTNKPTTYPLGFDDVDVTQEIEKIEKAEKRLIKKAKQKPKPTDSISELLSDYSDLLDSLFESDGQDDKYVHIGYGKYKEKGKEDVENAPTFKKDENGKYVLIKSDNGNTGQQKTPGTPVQGADMFKHDKSVKQPKEEPKSEPTKSSLETTKIANELKNRKTADGEELDVDTTPNGSLIIGVEHGEGTESTKKTIEQIQKLPKDTKVMFVGEGGMSKDKNGKIEFVGEQDEIRNAVKGHFNNAEESSWDENADISNEDSPVFDEVAQSLGGSKSKAKASIWSNMVGQGDDLLAEDYLDDEGKTWLIDQAKKGGVDSIDENTDFDNLTDEQKEDIYQLNFRDDDGYGETEITKGQEAYNEFRQRELDRKIKEAEDNGYTVIAPVGNSHVDLRRQRTKNNNSTNESSVPSGANGSFGNYAFFDYTPIKKRKLDNKKANFNLKDSGQTDLEAEADLDEIAVQTDVIPGGLAKSKTIMDFVKKYDAKGYYDPSQMAEYIKQKIKDGAKVEMEHTSDIRFATEIAKDHVWEDINYYTKLKKVETDEAAIPQNFNVSASDYHSIAPIKKRKLDTMKANFPTKHSGQTDLEAEDDEDEETDELGEVGIGTGERGIRPNYPAGDKLSDRMRDVQQARTHTDSDPEYQYKPINEVKTQSVINYYKAICKKLNLTPLPIKFGAVGHAGAATTFDTKTFTPEYISFDLNKITDIERAVLHEVTHQILLLKQQNPYHNCHKSAGFKKVENKLIDKFFYSSESALLREELIKEITKGLFGGTIKIGGESVKLEAELIGVDNVKKAFIVKVIHIDKKYWNKLPSNGILEIPARIFRTPGGGWYKLKHSAFESELSEVSAMGNNAAFQNDGNSTTGYSWNPDWDDYDNQKYYLDNLPGWSTVAEKPSEYEKKKATDQGLPIANHNDGKTSKYNRILKQNFKEPLEFLKTADINESILTEGGAYGHMNHPFDTEINLTFGQLKDIVNRALDGNLELSREKTDGQALAISWVKGKLVAARNKGHLTNRGANALDINAVASKFAGRGELEKAYNFAMQDLTKAINSLSDKQKEKIFKNGACFMNLEVIYPTSVNVIPYGQPLLVFHGTMEYNESGEAIGEDPQAGKILAGMVKQVNQDVQDNYTIQGPPVLKLPKSQDLSSKKPKYLAKISKLQKEFGLGDTAGVAEYHQAWWENFVDKKSPTTLDNNTKIGLVKRWAFGEKGFRIDKNTIKDEKTLNWATKIDKEDHKNITKDNLMKFEDIFLGVGAEVLSFTASVLTVNPDSAVRDMKKRLEQTIKDVEASGDPKKIEKLKLELKRLTAIGGPSKIVPIEGIVFVYNGQTFKLTGAFASLNQLLGIFY